MRKKFMRNPVRKGFTLIELVVALAVFSLMMLLMMQFLQIRRNCGAAVRIRPICMRMPGWRWT